MILFTWHGVYICMYVCIYGYTDIQFLSKNILKIENILLLNIYNMV